MPRLGLGQSLTGGAVTSAVIPHSLVFDGTDDIVDLGDLTILPGGTTTGTFSAWARKNTSGISTSQEIIAKWNSVGTTYKEWRMLWNFNSNIYFGTSPDNTTQINLTGGETLSANTWYNIVCTFHPTEKNKIYIDGALDKTSGSAMSSGIDDGGNNIFIGKNGDGGESHFDGYITDVAIWKDVALDLATVQSIYNNGTPNDLTKTASYTTGSGVDKSGDLVGYWRMNEGTGVTLKDSSVSGNNGTIDGAVYSTEVPS